MRVKDFDENATVMDINSSYCYVLHSKSGNRYPVGQPDFLHFNYSDTDSMHILMRSKI